jgi:hypothetical protein
MGWVDGTMISTAPLAMFVIEGGVTRVRFKIVGCIENGFTPLSCQLHRLVRMRINLLDRLGRTGTNVHFDLNDVIDRWLGI